MNRLFYPDSSFYHSIPGKIDGYLSQCQIDAKHTPTSDEQHLRIYHYDLRVYTNVWDCEIQSQNPQVLLEVRNIEQETNHRP